jgi:hypothetical protein
MITETTYRVLYYTMQGIRHKDFTSPMKARRFFDNHVSKHPEYQHGSYSKTELVVLEPETPSIDKTEYVVDYNDNRTLYEVNKLLLALGVTDLHSLRALVDSTKEKLSHGEDL